MKKEDPSILIGSSIVSVLVSVMIVFSIYSENGKTPTTLTDRQIVEKISNSLYEVHETRGESDKRYVYALLNATLSYYGTLADPDATEKDKKAARINLKEINILADKLREKIKSKIASDKEELSILEENIIKNFENIENIKNMNDRWYFTCQSIKPHTFCLGFF